MSEEPRIVSAAREVAADAAAIFELIADPARQPEWDGNDNLAEADIGQRVRAVGDVFVMHNVSGKVIENRVVEFEEGRLIAWLPAIQGEPPMGQLWRWELEPAGEGRTLVRHTYDWTGLHDPERFERARSFTVEGLSRSIERLAVIAEAL
ncbi:SRPBCC family protein [Leucobacter ruminantium]|uniref:SRPBCC family protein n=1 Tax=Leucobacter ruminantium TaxID=1289170 RepID=A0A939LXK0_9MICO|nr:SRPBCC family protein [Leucobacter ruminantium]MBO1805936.1 SRPBCC family protein [Leucobacter ruminantium]